MRLNQYLAHASGLSRRQADVAIGAGRVQVNGMIAAIGTVVAPSDRVELDQEPLTPPRYQTIMLHKPRGYITSRRQQGKAPTVYALLPPELAALKPIGRLDRDSSGLLLLTNDGQLAQQLQHPSGGKRKRYQVELDRPLAAGALAQLRRGVQLEDGISRLDIRPQENYLEVWLGEGRNRQIRRSFAAGGYRVTRLHRTDIGDTTLGRLAVGQWQPVSPPRPPRNQS